MTVTSPWWTIGCSNDSQSSMMRKLLAGVVLLPLLSACNRQVAGDTTPTSSASSNQRLQILTDVGPLQGSLWLEMRLAAPDGSAVPVFVVHDNQPKPLVILLQGSGCLPLFYRDSEGAAHGTSIFEDVVQRHHGGVHFAIVEKRGVSLADLVPGTSRRDLEAQFHAIQNGRCSREYFQHETEPERAEDVMNVVTSLARAPWVTSVLLVGHSEGAQVVAGVLRRDSPPTIAAAALLSGAGPTQFFEGNETTERMLETFGEMRQLMVAKDDEMYLGHPARRWKSYAIDRTPLEDIHDTKTPLYVAVGEREPSIRASYLFVLEALRQRAERPVRFVIVPGGHHDYSDATGRDRFGDVFDDFLRWATSGPRSSDAVRLK